MLLEPARAVGCPASIAEAGHPTALALIRPSNYLSSGFLALTAAAMLSEPTPRRPQPMSPRASQALKVSTRAPETQSATAIRARGVRDAARRSLMASMVPNRRLRSRPCRRDALPRGLIGSDSGPGSARMRPLGVSDLHGPAQQEAPRPCGTGVLLGHSWVVHETCQQADPGPRFPVVVQGRGLILYTVDRRRRAEAVRLMRRQWLAPARWECREVGFER